jgi:hypothetical protein
VAIRYERTVSFLDVMPKSRPPNEQTHGVEYSTELVGIKHRLLGLFSFNSMLYSCSRSYQKAGETNACLVLWGEGVGHVLRDRGLRCVLCLLMTFMITTLQSCSPTAPSLLLDPREISCLFGNFSRTRPLPQTLSAAFWLVLEDLIQRSSFKFHRQVLVPRKSWKYSEDM